MRESPSPLLSSLGREFHDLSAATAKAHSWAADHHTPRTSRHSEKGEKAVRRKRPVLQAPVPSAPASLPFPFRFITLDIFLGIQSGALRIPRAASGADLPLLLEISRTSKQSQFKTPGLPPNPFQFVTIHPIYPWLPTLTWLLNNREDDSRSWVASDKVQIRDPAVPRNCCCLPAFGRDSWKWRTIRGRGVARG